MQISSVRFKANKNINKSKKIYSNIAINDKSKKTCNTTKLMHKQFRIKLKNKSHKPHKKQNKVSQLFELDL